MHYDYYNRDISRLIRPTSTAEYNHKIIELLSQCVKRHPNMTFQRILLAADITNINWNNKLHDSSSATIRDLTTAINRGCI